MSKIILSIVIPAYNLKMHVEDALSSIYNQGVERDLFETIIVDDASYDGTSAILDKIRDQYDNLTVIHSKHIGVSAVRNIGIRKSVADYITFLDGDDLLIANALKQIIEELKKKEVDCLVGRSYLVGRNNRELYPWYEYLQADRIYQGMDVLESDYMRGSIWGMAISRELINSRGISFLEGARNGEDSMFFLMTCLNHPRVVFKEIDIVHKMARKGSASYTMSLSRFAHYKLCIDYLVEQKEKFTSSLERKHIDRMLYIMISMVVYGFTSKGYFIPKRIYSFYELNRVFPLIVSYGVVNKWKMILMNRSFFCYNLFSWVINRIRN